MKWKDIRAIKPRKYICAYCGRNVASDKGFVSLFERDNSLNYSYVIYICPMCDKPTYFESFEQIPQIPFGDSVDNLPKDIDVLYNEARKCMSVSGCTAAVMLCRKILMNTAVSEGAPQNKSYNEYVQHLADNNYIPPKGKGWVDQIRQKGNEANHEIILMTKEDAENIIQFVGMLLKFIYELPSKIPTKP